MMARHERTDRSGTESEESCELHGLSGAKTIRPPPPIWIEDRGWRIGDPRGFVTASKHGLRNRMPAGGPAALQKRVNRLSINMANSRRQKDGKKMRKAILREIKKLTRRQELSWIMLSHNLRVLACKRIAEKEARESRRRALRKTG